MVLFGLFGRSRRARSRSAQEKLEEIEVASRLEGLEDRRTARALALESVNSNRPELLRAAELLRPRRGRGPLVAPPYETREGKIVDVLLARALMDPDEKLDELRERALKRRQLLRQMDDDDEDEDDSPGGMLKQRGPMLLLAAPMLLNPQVAERMAPMFERMFAGNQPPATEPAQQSVVVQPVQNTTAAAAPPAPLATSAPAPTPTEATESAAVVATPSAEGAHVTVHPTMVLHALRAMEPAAFAGWIVQQPGGYQFAEWLSEIPEPDLKPRLEQYASMPRIGPLAQWGDVVDYLTANIGRAEVMTNALRALYDQESQAI